MKTTKTLALLLLAAAVGNSALAQTAITLPPNRAYNFTGTAASGSGTLSYQWYRNGAAISGATSQNYSMPAGNANGVGVEIKRGTTSSNCAGQVTYSNIYNVSFCGIIVNNVCWASENAGANNTFGSRPDEYTPYFQWNRATAWASTGSISGWNSTADNSTTWTVNPCPDGWRLPTRTEFENLNNVSTTGAYAGTRGNVVDGRFYCTNGTNSEECTLPNNMVNCIFLPAGGNRNRNTGSLFNQSFEGYYWSGTQTNAANGYTLYFNLESYYAMGTYDKAVGMNIRCVQ